ncbi:hypothetical protein M3I54_07435 [Paraburkholderia sp. CNPSo 3274]|uniref:hypothetical protein n=1 Tax=Paraburkholderia sp. CNPSo 3274 TaxID=2940932 RepID=UPI0020B7427E|nr:hypothetical protein [Paraburkholderia sp. CNPSo 3274]MCP3706820.1 hypothetical protein [Paraburkholderia sp. CNPSo 3274]
MASNYCLSSGEFGSLEKAYGEQSIDAAYGLTMILLCYENASSVFADCPELDGLRLWIEDFAHAADEGLQYLDRYNDSLKMADVPAATAKGDAADRIGLTQLNEWMGKVLGLLDFCLNQGLGVREGDISEEERRIDAYIEAVMARVREVVYDARDLVLKKISHTEKLGKPDSIDVASMFGEVPIEPSLAADSPKRSED